MSLPAGQQGGGTLTGTRWVLDSLIIQLAVRWAVPCFLMISGALLLDPRKEMGIGKVLAYMRRMALILATVGLCYCMIETFLSGWASNPLELIEISLRNLIEEKCWSHMGYLYVLLGLYAFTPLLRCFVKHTDERAFQFTLLVLFLLTIARRTVNTFLFINITGLKCREDACLFYYLAGYYLTTKTFCKKSLAAGLAVSSAGFAALIVYGNHIGLTLDAVISPSNLFVACYSMALFSLCKGSAWIANLAENRFIAQASKYSFGIYLFHPVFLNALNKGLQIFPDILPTGIGEAAFWVFAFFAAWLASALLCQIKFIKKLIL